MQAAPRRGPRRTFAGLAVGRAGGVAARVLAGGVVPGARGAVRRAHAPLRVATVRRRRRVLDLQALLAQQLAAAVRLRGGRREQRGLAGRAGGAPAGGVQQQAEVVLRLLAAAVRLPVRLERRPRRCAAPRVEPLGAVPARAGALGASAQHGRVMGRLLLPAALVAAAAANTSRKSRATHHGSRGTN